MKTSHKPHNKLNEDAVPTATAASTAPTSAEPEGVDVSPEGLQDRPVEAVAYAEEHNLGPNQTIVSVFTPDMKKKLKKMLRYGEFNKKEAAVLKYLMTEEGNLDDLSVMLGAASKRTNGAPMSKVAALRELNRILEVIAKRSYVKLGRRVDLSKIKEYKIAMRKADAERHREQKEQKRLAREAYKEFWAALKDLNATQRKHGLKPSRYDKIWTQNTQSLDQIRSKIGQDRI